MILAGSNTTCVISCLYCEYDCHYIWLSGAPTRSRMANGWAGQALPVRLSSNKWLT